MGQKMKPQTYGKLGLTEDEIIGQAVATFGAEAQTDMMLEEMSELAKALLKYRRYHSEQFLYSIREELADVEIMLKQMGVIYGDYSGWKDMKLSRLEMRLGLEGGTNNEP